MKNPELSIVIPFYNEKQNILPVLNTYIVFKKSYNFELICVNNGSFDGSTNEFNRIVKTKKYPFIKVVTVKKNKGYGYGIMRGVKSAKGEIIAWTHADMQTRSEDVFAAFDTYNKYNDPNRIIKGNRVNRAPSAFLFSLGMAVIASIMLRKIFYEINAQPKLFHKSFLQYLKNAPDDFSLDLFFLYIAKKHGYKITSIDVIFHNRLYGKSKWAYSLKSRWKTITRTLSYINHLANNNR